MTATLENIFGIQEDHPDVCSSTTWKTFRASDGSIKRLQLPCTSDDRCNVCQYNRSKQVCAYFFGVNYLPPDKPVYFVTLTIDPQYVKSSDPQIVADYGRKQFRSFRKNHMTGPDICWARVFEFGKQNGRFHVHMLVVGNHPFAEAAKAPNVKGGRRKWLAALTPAARQTYKLLQGYGFGIYHCEQLLVNQKAVGYLAGYVSKSVKSESWVKGTRLVDASRNWPRRYAEYQKRYCYIPQECVREMPQGSDLLVKQFHQLDPMLHQEAMQTDIDFQLGDFRMKPGFWILVKDMLRFRKLSIRYSTKVPKERRRVVKRFKDPSMCLNQNERTLYHYYHQYEESWTKLGHIHHYYGSRRFLIDAIQFPEVFNEHDYDRFIVWFFQQHPKITL